MKFTPKSISEAGDDPDSHVSAIPGHHMVQYGPDWTPSIHFLLGINVALVKFAPKSISEAGDGPDCQVSAISGPHVVRQGWNSHQMIKIKFCYHL